MIEKVASSMLPVDEEFRIQKNSIHSQASDANQKRICIVTGTHGDELEGQYVCYEVQRRLQENLQHLKGIVDIYPALNPLGVDTITRGVPKFDLDMNRIFPGNTEGTMVEYAAAKIIEDMSGADMVIDIHASNIFLKEIPQVRINEMCQETLVPYAKRLNIDYIWIHSAATVLESTLAHSLNMTGTPCLVVEMGVGMRITREYGNQLTDGIFTLMKDLGIWDGPVTEPKEPIVSTDGNVSYLNAAYSGIFVPCVEHWINVKKGEKIGEIVDPLTGALLEEVLSPVTGVLFTLREYPVVYEGSLVGRILERD
ncbi:MAG: M14 family metallopeptidase [Anaerostipes sp.]|nr:M14 family metallopeptidase [Anaerostipes sp.]MDD5969632.1 M14 family metallopeptidase [Anaerostipes sp.]